MASRMGSPCSQLLTLLIAILLLHASPVAAFGAGNIASISKIEGHNWRHGDIEDMLKTIAFLRGHKWTSMMVRRVYFGNWLRDYSQAMDVGTLKGVQSDTIRILVWILSFLSFGYATAEFEVTQERLGVYRPEEHIDNPKGYADDQDARKFDQRLRGPVQRIELEIDPQTGMKNYIGNEKLGIATSSGYIKFSFNRSIHYGRLYTSGAGGSRGREADLHEALRCLGQGLHCLEDFGAHTNYTELALREMGYRDVFPHTGSATEINLKGHRVFPLITGTFGVVDFLHSVIGEATDHFAQTEVEQLDLALKNAEASSISGGGTRGIDGPSGLSNMTGLLGQVPGTGDFVRQAEELQAQSDAQRQSLASGENKVESQPNTTGQGPMSNIPGTNIDPVKTVKAIYPILEFRDRVAKALSATIEKIPGLQALVEKITETLTLFVLSLLAPFIRPIINAVSKQLKAGSGGVIDASGKHQYEPWTDPHCSDPTHSLLSKDHFSNILNEPAGQVAAVILQYVAPRIIYAWEHPDVPVDQVLNDVVRVFHHPAARDNHCEIHRNMYSTVEKWVHSRPDGGSGLNHLLGSESVRQGKNHTVSSNPQQQHHNHGGLPSNIPGMSSISNMLPSGVSNMIPSGISNKIPHNIPHSMSNVLPSGVSNFLGSGSHSKVSGSPWAQLGRFREIDPNEASDASAASQPLSQQEPYGQSSYPPSEQQPAQWQQPYSGQAPPAPQYGYSGGPQHGYDPNAQQQQQQGYGYQGATPGQYYGAPPPPQY